MPKPRLYADPRTGQIAARLMADAMQDVAARMLAGQDHYAARDAVLRELSPAWLSIAGKAVADEAVRGLHYLAPAEYLTPRERTIYARVQAAQDGRGAAKARAAGRGWRACVGLLQALVALVLLIGAVLVMTGAQAAERGARWKALAACGVATMNTPEYERRCRRFSRTQRATVRDYDGPGVGAPREWERPKTWE